MNSIKIESSWKSILEDEFKKQYFITLVKKIKSEYTNKKIFPPGNQIFNAFNLCSFQKTKVIIVGQDPYHNVGQANGLCFSVNKNIALPPSLKNIYKELYNDTGVKNCLDGNLEKWANQGVLLLNSILTVEKNVPGSHKDMGWEIFTDSVITKLSLYKKNLVFLLWGSYAIKKGASINKNKHLVLTSPHPSPFSAHKGFFGNKHFSKTNNYLATNNLEVINW